MREEEAYYFIKSFMWFALEKCRQWEDAEDVIQDVAIRILSRLEWFNSLTDQQKAWYVKRCVSNRNIDQRRRRKRWLRHYNPVFDTKYTPAEAYSIIELKQVMQKGKHHPFFESLVLFASGYSQAEVAQRVGVSINTIHGRFRYARKFLLR